MPKKSKLSKHAETLIISVFLLIGIGIVMTYSASAVYADKYYGDSAFYLKRQLIFVFMGLVALFGCMRIPPNVIQKFSLMIVGVSLVLLVLVFIPGIGRSGGGAQRWIGIMQFNIQPAELAKLAVCIYLSDYLVRKTKKIDEGGLAVFIPPAILIGMISVLVILQPDLGSVAFIMMVTLLLFFIAGIKWRYIFIGVGTLLPTVLILILIEPYRFRRVVAFLNPWEDPKGSGYQIIQSYLAFAMGGLKGVGLGASTQKLFYLPQSHTDFIFSIIGEELGFIGALFVIFLYATILWQGAQITKSMKDPFCRLLGSALTLLVSIQAVLNLMVATGLIPTKGLVLPFLSYGGSSLVFNMAAIGLLMSLDYHKK